MHYIVVGADEASGQECTLTIEAEDEASAAAKARSKGVFPTRIDPLLAQPAKVEDPKAITAGQIIIGVCTLLLLVWVLNMLQRDADRAWPKHKPYYQDRNVDTPGRLESDRRMKENEKNSVIKWDGKL